VGSTLNFAADTVYGAYKLVTAPGTSLSYIFGKFSTVFVASPRPEYVLVCRPSHIDGLIPPYRAREYDAIRKDVDRQVNGRYGDDYVRLRVAMQHGEYPVVLMLHEYGNIEKRFAFPDKAINQSCSGHGEVLEELYRIPAAKFG
jgi:hypothetical protein